MYDLRSLNGSYKGYAGECMFKLTRKWAVLLKFWNKNKYFSIFEKYLSFEQCKFIAKYWNSIDSIEISFTNKKKEIILYEIKTKNVYRKKIHYKLKITKNIVDIFSEAKSLGFLTKSAIVLFYDNWNYSVEIEDFDQSKFYIDKLKIYDKAGEGTILGK